MFPCAVVSLPTGNDTVFPLSQQRVLLPGKAKLLVVDTVGMHLLTLQLAVGLCMGGSQKEQ